MAGAATGPPAHRVRARARVLRPIRGRGAAGRAGPDERAHRRGVRHRHRAGERRVESLLSQIAARADAVVAAHRYLLMVRVRPGTADPAPLPGPRARRGPDRRGRAVARASRRRRRHRGSSSTSPLPTGCYGRLAEFHPPGTVHTRLASQGAAAVRRVRRSLPRRLHRAHRGQAERCHGPDPALVLRIAVPGHLAGRPAPTGGRHRAGDDRLRPGHHVPVGRPPGPAGTACLDQGQAGPRRLVGAHHGGGAGGSPGGTVRGPE